MTIFSPARSSVRRGLWLGLVLTLAVVLVAPPAWAWTYVTWKNNSFASVNTWYATSSHNLREGAYILETTELNYHVYAQTNIYGQAPIQASGLREVNLHHSPVQASSRCKLTHHLVGQGTYMTCRYKRT